MTPAGVMRPTGVGLDASVNQTFPSGPAVIANGAAPAVGVGNSVIAPVLGMIRAIRFAVCSVNQTLPSGPAVICCGPAFAVGMSNSVTPPAVVTRATWFDPPSVIHIPPGPFVMLVPASWAPGGIG